MCGIIAITSDYKSPISLDKSLSLISHRGPDASGTFNSKNGDCQLGHVRLSILDLSSLGEQPMLDSSGRYVITYNGEIYNYADLKKSLEKKHGLINWKSSCDTEVIIEGFARDGKSFLGKLNGIFSIIIYDTRSELLYVLRDPLGIKPLYRTSQNGCVYFSSEVKGYDGIKKIKKTIRKQSLADVLSFMYVPEPHTMFHEITRVEPGVCFIYSKGKYLSSSYLFDKLTKPITFSSNDEMVDTFKRCFSDSVQRQLISDVPMSLFLSGGLDSSAIAFEAMKKGGNIKDAYTIAFSSDDIIYDQQSNDLKYAELVANKLGIKLNVIEAKSDMISLIPKITQFLEDGLADPAALNTYLICKGAKENGIKVLLSGQGADEYLGGYRRYFAEKLIKKFPISMLKMTSSIGAILPESIPGKYNGSFRRLKKLTALGSKTGTERLLDYYLWSSSGTINNLFLNPLDLIVGLDHQNLFKEFKDENTSTSMMLIDQKFDLTSLNLAYTDKMSMSMGIEARVPFLDFELVQLMNSIPLSMKIKSSRSKYILKQSMKGFLPDEVINRKKAGFSLPIRSWLKNENELVNFYLDKTRIDKQGIFNSSNLNQLIKEQVSGNFDHSYLLFSMLVLQIWLEENIDNTKFAA
jgi:asparagine synthase (glutamine-hydrolysing)